MKKSNVVSEIRKEIQKRGGLKSFSAQIRRNRPVGCPMKGNMIDELQQLTNEEIHVAFYIGLIGNNSPSRQGSIVKNSKLGSIDKISKRLVTKKKHYRLTKKKHYRLDEYIDFMGDFIGIYPTLKDAKSMADFRKPTKNNPEGQKHSQITIFTGEWGDGDIIETRWFI